ncbi:MAG TPA: BlaI/MecI/CopY family transcriptional regulator [Gemmataceae bacterium]|jgi:predicted transcriptional regulator|nr:BlaI/MecI/CopY family transcriptional regulator [Gemmataceae bacterium]
MGHSLPNITEAEWAVLQRLWDRGPATVRQLADALYPGGGASEYATVHKLLERLDAKGCVRRGRRVGVYLFEAAVERDDVIGRQLEELVEKMCGGSLQPLLTNLIRAKRLTPAELRGLLSLVEDLDPKSRRKKDRG